jgi:hypothetical protein
MENRIREGCVVSAAGNFESHARRLKVEALVTAARDCGYTPHDVATRPEARAQLLHDTRRAAASDTTWRAVLDYMIAAEGTPVGVAS